jgi:hypothetical protein
MCNLQSQPPRKQNQKLVFKEENRRQNKESLKTWNEALTCKKKLRKGMTNKKIQYRPKFNVEHESKKQ